MIVTRVANSHHRATARSSPSCTIQEKRNATVMASAIRVIIPGRRSLSSRHAPWRNTQPPYRNTAVASTGGIQSDPGNSGAR
jgi:hypothetical protein